MNKILSILGGTLLLSHAGAYAQQVQRCGAQIVHEHMIATDPSWAQKLADQKATIQADAEAYLAMKAKGEKTTAVAAVPVIFHIVLDSAQFNNIGGEAGVAKRCDSQIAVLNRDYNKQNADSTLIPSGWKALYANVGIHFGLARRTPTGQCTPGYEIKLVTADGFSNINDAFPEAKAATTGLVAWDNTKYYNVWCINFTGGASNLLGITVPQSQASFYPANGLGVVIRYTTLGCTGPNSGVAAGSASITYGAPPAGTGTYAGGGWEAPYNLGRTLTHETGHFLEIWHPWGDDGGLCPWETSGSDDNITDTPPESDATYGNPAYTITGGTLNDGCKLHDATNVQPIGIASLSYMDYTDDDAMHMFTTLQGAKMASEILVATGENYSLTQHPELLVCPTGVEQIETGSSLNIYPNPTSGIVNLTVSSQTEELKEITVLNMMGQEITNVKGQQKDNYSIDLSGMSKGIYFVRCNFASGSITRKITLQ